MSKQLVITGDVAIDHLYLSIPPGNGDENWLFYPKYQTFLLPGGAFLLADFTRHAVETIGIETSIASPKPPENLAGEDAPGMVHAKISLSNYEDIKDNKRIRVKEYLGYSKTSKKKDYEPLIVNEPGNVDLLLLDDAGNGFRNNASYFPKSLSAKETLVLYKMSRPLAEGVLWEKVKKREGACVLVINIKDLRSYKNVNISKGLSWERTALETVFTIGRSESLYSFHKASFIVVLFGTDGALLYPQDKAMKPSLIFDPDHLEGGFASTIRGLGLSINSVFTAALGAYLLKQDGIAGIKEGIKTGLNAMRNLLKKGFIINKDGEISYPSNEIFTERLYQYAECGLERANNLTTADPFFFRILDKKTQNIKLLAAADIVKNKLAKILNEIPVGKFEELETFDRREIEQFNAIKALVQEFLNDPKPSRPLCFAVFGPPGSGKSFGIKKVLASLNIKDIETLTFNISQYESYNELIADFHKIRDKVLAGKIPVAFFDEFDSNHNNQVLGWLKYFLSPMQDGEFKEGEALRPLGKCIFVFAGGTKFSFEEFELPIRDKHEINASSQKENIDFFRDAKGSDFISRLRGFVDIMGPNPYNRKGETDAAYMIRRAKILRTTFEKTSKTRQLINTKGELQIDQGVLRAMLNIPEYRHGNRSLTALIDMSRVADKKEFELSSLPTQEQLDMHVDAKLFMWMATKERFYTLLPTEERFGMKHSRCMEWERELIETIAKELHNDYVKQRILSNEKTSTLKAWEELPDNKKKSNFDAAEDIPAKLTEIGHAIRKIPGATEANIPVIFDDEIDMLAEREHKRWCLEQGIQGWKYGKQRDNELEIHHLLTDWEKLPANERIKDFLGVYAIPLALRKAGYEIFRMEEYLPFVSEDLITALARAIHEDYAIKRKQKGHTIETNTSIVDFEKLSPHLYGANIDSARSIPRKLASLNIELHKKFDGPAADLLMFTDEEVEQLSQWEHSRWTWQKIMQGWSYAPGKKDEEKKTNPCIIPWSELTEEIKDYDRESIRLIPQLIQQVGYYAMRKEK